MALQGLSGRSLQGFTRSLQAFGGIGNIYLCNQSGDNILKYGAGGTFKSSFAPGKSRPTGIAYYDGLIYFAELNGAAVYVYQPDGTSVLSFSTDATPTGLEVFNDEIYVSSTTTGDITVYDLSGNEIRSWSTPSGFQPFDISILDNELYVSGSILPFTDHRIRVYSLTGSFIREWGTTGTGDGEFPTGPFITGVVGYKSEIYTMQGTAVQVFSTEGVYSRRWTIAGIAMANNITIKNGICVMNSNVSGTLSVYITSTNGSPIGDFATSQTITESVNLVGIAVS
jgi:tripartite motif-containing protein 71